MTMKLYETSVNGMTTLLRLSEAEAKRRGLTEAKKVPANKGRTPANKGRGRAPSTPTPADPAAPTEPQTPADPTGPAGGAPGEGSQPEG